MQTDLFLSSTCERSALPGSQVCLEVQVAGCGLMVGQCPSPDWGERHWAAVSPTSAQIACWLKTPEAGSLQAAPLKLNTHSSVHLRLTLTERLIFSATSSVLTTSVNAVLKSYLKIRKDAALYISFHIFVIIKIAAQTENWNWLLNCTKTGPLFREFH